MLCRKNENNPIQYGIGLDQFFNTRYQKMGDWIALGIQSNDLFLGLGLYHNPVWAMYLLEIGSK
jgi:hypothetical protein